jgi:RpiB/LacA/LacB family sugar-phosphate isomerase
MNKRIGSTTELLQRRVRLLGEKAPLFYDEPLHLVRGEGVWLYDADGKRYMDVYNNVPSVGHCHPHVMAALTRQAQTLNTHTRYLHETIIEYGERLTATLDESLSMAYFVCTGSEANELALRIARQHTEGMGIIGTNATYHGNTAALFDLDTLFTAGVSMSPHIRTVPFPESYRPLHGLSGVALVDAYVAEVQAAIDAFAADGIKFAGLLVCPIFANEGLPDVPPGYWAKVIKIVHNAGGLLIFDEVQSGFGRTGKMWGYESIGVVPDIITMGKPMGNGHPLAAVVSREDIVTKFQDDTMYFNTFGGNPVSCAVGMAVLDVIEQENLIKNAARVGTYLANGLRKLQEKHDLIGDVRGRGLFFGVELVLDRHTKTPAPRETNRVVNMMKERGILINKIGPHNNILKMRPLLPFSYENADQLLFTLDDTLATLYSRQESGFSVTRGMGQDAHGHPPQFASRPNFILSSPKKKTYTEAKIENLDHQAISKALNIPAGKIIYATTLKQINPHTQLNILANTIVTPLARQVALERNITLTNQPTNHRTNPLTNQPTLALGADHGGYTFKEQLKPTIQAAGYQIIDCGTHSNDSVDYPDIAYAVARHVADGTAQWGIIIDGTGIGSCMTANKVPGVRAALCYNQVTAVNSREHNHANVLTLGAGLIGSNLAKQIVHTWLTTDFGSGRHARRVKKITRIEQPYPAKA